MNDGQSNEVGGAKGSALRRGLAVAAGVIVVVVLSIGTDAVLHATGVFPPIGQAMSNGLFVLATAYRTVYGVAGGYVAARSAPDRPMLCAVTVGIVGFVLGMIGVLATWNSGPEFGPRWYPIALVVVSVPCGWIGGRLLEMSRR